MGKAPAEMQGKALDWGNMTGEKTMNSGQGVALPCLHFHYDRTVMQVGSAMA